MENTARSIASFLLASGPFSRLPFAPKFRALHEHAVGDRSLALRYSPE
jgi:hypothetical protein